MKPEELMLGDIVTFEDCQHDENPVIIKIWQINQDGDAFAFIDNDAASDEIVIDDEIVGLPLTPEILEKNGWKREFDKTEYMVKYNLGEEGKNCWMMWAIKEHNLDIQRQDEKLDVYNLKVQRVCIPCDYVHELQHALKLCGIKKEIEL